MILDHSRRTAQHALLAACFALSIGVACGDDDKAGSGSNGVSGGDAGKHDDHDDGNDAGAANPCSNKTDGTACLDGRICVKQRCLWNICGDGVKAGDEECDDGNQTEGDGCSPGCQREMMGCGDGKREGSEECDDGNRIDNDACSNMCTKNMCGNGRVDVGEECDDGNTVNDDKCSNDCKEVRCRNGRVDPGEECDDGNAIDTDGCTNACKIRICGDGKIEDKEECDDGNMSDMDACSNKCTKNVCGNKRVDPGEQCDGSLDCDANCRKVDDQCSPCERKNCTYIDCSTQSCDMEQKQNAQTFLDTFGSPADLVSGCLDDHPDPQFMAGMYTPGEFASSCMSVLSCVRTNKCYKADTGSDSCLCGNLSSTDCITKSPPSDAPCVMEIEKALGSTDITQVSERAANPAYPGGNAYQLLICDQTFCKKECMPWLP